MFLCPRMFCKWLALIAVGVGYGVAAEEPALHRLRVLAVGDPPPFIQEVRDGARWEVAAPAGSIPPRLVTVPQGDDASRSPLRIRLGQSSSPVMLPLPKDGRIELKSEQGAKWLDLPLYPGAASIALVWRGGRDWTEARALVMADDSAARLEGSVHFFNLTASPLAVIIGTEKIRLEPGKSFTRQVTPEDGSVPLEILYPTTSGGLKLCHSSSLEASRGNFSRFVIYAADGAKPRMPVKVLHLQEPG